MCGLGRWILMGLVAAVSVTHTQRADAANGTVGTCTEAGFTAVLATVDSSSGGGTITFTCGPATIPFTSYKQIANAVTIDGGGTITFDGGNASPFLQISSTAHVLLKRLTFQKVYWVMCMPSRISAR